MSRNADGPIDWKFILKCQLGGHDKACIILHVFENFTFSQTNIFTCTKLTSVSGCTVAQCNPPRQPGYSCFSSQASVLCLHLEDIYTQWGLWSVSSANEAKVYIFLECSRSDGFVRSFMISFNLPLVKKDFYTCSIWDLVSLEIITPFSSNQWGEVCSNLVN